MVARLSIGSYGLRLRRLVAESQNPRRGHDVPSHRAEEEDAAVAASSSSSIGRSEPEEKIAAEIDVLKDLDLPGLRLRRRKLFRSSAPAHLPKYLLFRIIAYKIQANAFGDLDRETIRYLDRIAKDYVRRREAGETRSRKRPPPVPPVPSGRSLKIGTILVREHDRALQRVIVVEGGFLWNEVTYKSLSEVARAITGTNWNGPRFFGLRDKKGRGEAADEEVRP